MGDISLEGSLMDPVHIKFFEFLMTLKDSERFYLKLPIIDILKVMG